MRLWSLHPSYLDAKGLTALWREGLLAKAVLEGKTRGYKHHPQLERFKSQPDWRAAINAYLWEVAEEAGRRGYCFDTRKLDERRPCPKIRVTEGQLHYEWAHLQAKLLRRDPERYQRNASLPDPQPHPLMEVLPGPVEPWERPDHSTIRLSD
ncbi:MAG: pyrimidine dimer DNA glycosylase/endonuclease V [Anaerolineae bacterium]